ncbi:UDP-N-acetylglucosamine 2-epimerase (non-hydrolyzing) [Lachnospiraceae bacterium]|nr:UDP-N-acetylglucosamine 2-epimerase (non-hydrolyzing) [Lachnospiraceae bacterium]
MKVVSVVGARPQFIKAAAVSRVIRSYAEEILVHTGQHYDSDMSDIFFEELDIPRPDYYLGVGSGTHARQTAEMLIGLEEIYLKEKPDFVLVYGDTNSTLAGALAASKILIPVIHVEAGLRSFNMAMPEEQNRILTDHISEYLFCPTQTAVSHLRNENITNHVYQIGDVMCDAVLFYLKKVKSVPHGEFMDRLSFLFQWKKPLERWYIATVHRAENTQNKEKLSEILKAFEELEAPVIFPVHPRIRKFVNSLMERNHYSNVCFVEPLGYLEMLFFTSNAVKVITDSGGLQKEAYIMHKNVVTLRTQTEWVETLEGNHNILCPIDKSCILEAVRGTDIAEEFNDFLYGNGNAAQIMCDLVFHRD